MKKEVLTNAERAVLEHAANWMSRYRIDDPQNKWRRAIWFEVEETYRDYGAGIVWETIICYSEKINPLTGMVYQDSYQMLYPNQHAHLLNMVHDGTWFNTTEVEAYALELYEECLYVRYEREED